MITCSNTSLIFDFEDCTRALRACATVYIAEWLPKIKAPEPTDVVERVLAKQPWLSARRTEEARNIAKTLTRERMADEFSNLVHAEVAKQSARLSISFLRTLRIPDDGKVYPLPPGLDSFPLRRIEPFSGKVPSEWIRRGGVLMPMYQAEAMWVEFSTRFAFAAKIGTGLVNAVDGQPWNVGLNRKPQGYVVLPEQPWLDGYCAGPGIIRQFVSARLGRGYTAEEQLSGSEHGGIQLEVFPVKPKRYFEKELQETLPRSAEDLLERMLNQYFDSWSIASSAECGVRMGLGAGGTMKQEIYKDPWEADDWDITSPLRVWVHLCDALRWHKITGELPPQKPITAQRYTDAGLPWFDYYRDDMAAIEGSPALANLKSVFAVAKEKTDDSIPQENSVAIDHVKAVGPHASASVSGWDGM